MGSEKSTSAGGWSSLRPGSDEERGLPPDQLYDLSADLGDQHNLAAEHPEIVERLTKILERYIADGRSTPGPRQANDAPIEIRKAVKVAPPKLPDNLPLGRAESDYPAVERRFRGRERGRRLRRAGFGVVGWPMSELKSFL
ncbi:MAG TPA: hypothetical protein VGO11_26455 [Chthoniobacteraceae bacterium]|jgi:hypothetical protein|nr:hypothetical protein [Chthoniobacteraceae bacterium]